MHRNGNPCNSLFIVNTASGMDRGRMRPTTTTTSRNMAAIQLIPSHAVLDCSIYLWYQISILCLIDSCHIKRSTDQYHITISRAHEGRMFFKFIADQVLVFDWMASSCQVNLSKKWEGLFGSQLTLTSTLWSNKLVFAYSIFSPFLTRAKKKSNFLFSYKLYTSSWVLFVDIF